MLTGGFGPTDEKSPGQAIRVPDTMLEKVDERLKQLEMQVAAAKRIREILAKNPDIKELLDLLPKVGVY
jgi:hypothetical protein